MILAIVLIMGVLMFLGFPLVMPLLVASIYMIVAYFPNTDPKMIIQQLHGGVTPFVLLAIPLFILASDIMAVGQTSNRLLDFVGKFVGHVKGGYAISAAAASTLFGAVSGSSQATVVAVGKPMRSKMLQVGYKDSHALALIVNAADIAVLIPPSIGTIMYAVVTGTSVGELFIAGVIPGLIIFLCFAVYSYIYASVKGIPRQEKSSWGERFQSLRKAIYPLGFPIIILGGIYSGIFTPTEAAGVSVLYALVVEMLIYRSIKVKDLYNISLSTGLVTAVIFILIAAGSAFSWAISYARIPQLLASSILGPDPSQLMVLVTVSLFFFVGCMFIDQIVVIMLLSPIFYPIAMEAGIDPIVLGTIIIIQVAIGASSPPFGVDIFTASAVFNKPYFTVVKGTPPFLIILILVAVFYILFPDFALIYRYILPPS